MGTFSTFDAPVGGAGTGEGGGRRAGPLDFGTGGEGAKAASRELRVAGDTIIQKEERADITNIATLKSTALADLTTNISGLRQSAEEGAPGHVENTRNAVNAYYEKLQDHATTDVGKLKLQQQQAEVLSHFTISEIGFQAVSSSKKVTADFSNSLNNDKHTMFASPDQATFDLLKDAMMDKINDPAGVIFNAKGADATFRAALLKDGLEDLTTARVQGLIRDDPHNALTRLEAGEFNEFLDADDVKMLRGEANTGITAVKTAETAARAEAERVATEQRRAAQDEHFNALHTGLDAGGEPITAAEVIQNIMTDPRLRSVEGLGSKKSMIATAELRAKGIATDEQDAARAADQQTFLAIYHSGVDVDGNAVSSEALKEMVLTSSLKVFGSGSQNTVLGMIDQRDAGSTSADYTEQNRMFDMVMTRQNEDGLILSDTQMMTMIRNSSLKPTGTGSKAAFTTMVREAAKLRKTETRDIYTNDFAARIMLPENDPAHISAEDLGTSEFIAAVGFDRAATLRQDALDLLDPAKKQIVESKADILARFKDAISKATLTKTDETGQDLFFAFKQEVERRIKMKQDAGEDVMVLFDDVRGNKEYLGNIVNRFIRDRTQQAASVRSRFEPHRPVTTTETEAGQADPAVRADGETAAEFLARTGGN